VVLERTDIEYTHCGRVILLVCLGLLCGLFCGRVAGSCVHCVQVGLRRTCGIKAGGRHDGGVSKAVWLNVDVVFGILAAIGCMI
jgi:hypothetical protein